MIIRGKETSFPDFNMEKITAKCPLLVKPSLCFGVFHSKCDAEI